jgi:hypothetical protein
MRRGEGVQLGQLRPEAGVACRGAGDERLGDGPERAERCSASAAAWPATPANLRTLADRLPEGAA